MGKFNLNRNYTEIIFYNYLGTLICFLLLTFPAAKATESSSVGMGKASRNSDTGSVKFSTNKGNGYDINNNKEQGGLKASSLAQLELGPGLFVLGLNDYRGSDQGRAYVFPIPYFIYRGKRIDAENTSVKGALYEAKHFRLGLSMMGSLPVSSSKNRARQGMPALDPTFELGLVGVYDFAESPEAKNYPSLGVALRSSYAINFWRASHVGYFSVPFITYTFLPQKYTGQSFIQASLSLMSADRSYHGYFYDVDPKYAKPERPAYKARGGYSGWHTSFYISKQSPPFSFYAFFRYDHLNGAAFADSPLVKTKDYFAGGIGLIWYIFQSEARAPERLREK